jgi:hypothetical protein
VGSIAIDESRAPLLSVTFVDGVDEDTEHVGRRRIDVEPARIQPCEVEDVVHDAGERAR